MPVPRRFFLYLADRPFHLLMLALTDRRRKEITSLAHRKYRERLGQMLIEGLRSVEAAMTAGAALVDVVVATSARGDAAVQALLAQAAVPVYVVPDDDFARLSAVQTSQGVLAVARVDSASEASLPELRAILALDGVQDPGNVGTLLRTAAWFGVEALLAGPGTADYYNPKTIRAAMGGLWDVRLVRTGDLGVALGRLRDGGFVLYGADLEGVNAARWEPRLPSVLVLGSEAHGLSPAVAALLDERVVVTGAKGRKGTESLNVAVAAGILIYQWQRGSFR